MNTKYLKYVPFLMLILSITVNSCSSDNDGETNNINNAKISFEIFNKHKGKLIEMEPIEFQKTATRLSKTNQILSEINRQYGTSIDYVDSFKSLDYTSSDEIFDWMINNTEFDRNDIRILTDLSDDLVNLSFSDAVLNLEGQLNLNRVSLNKRQQYTSIINGVRIIEFQYPGFFTAESSLKSWGCAFAVANLALASAGLVAGCNPAAAGATVGISCYIAAARFIVASGAVGAACSDE